MEKNLKNSFERWQELNKKVEESFGKFEFSAIKEVRKEQRKIEDSIYSILLENASEDLKNSLPSECGEMEIGYDMENKIFYYVMFDPDYEESEETKLMAITINLDKKVNIIKDFKE
ncbi:MAG: hypothetical protein EU532_04550 [Promethearchaeota archaeon]|nr:MAG: hypothetical protein EU532_04550 [Candidatus Lokiarchaeota archaeon]